MTQLNAPNRTARRLAPGPLDPGIYPEGNITDSYDYDAMIDRAWWGFILHAWRASRLPDVPGPNPDDAREEARYEGWGLYAEETDAWLAAR